MAEEICSDPHDLLRGHSGGVTCLAFSPDGGRLLSGGKDKVRVLTKSEVVYRAANILSEMWAKYAMNFFAQSPFCFSFLTYMTFLGLTCMKGVLF